MFLNKKKFSLRAYKAYQSTFSWVTFEPVYFKNWLDNTDKHLSLT